MSVNTNMPLGNETSVELSGLTLVPGYDIFGLRVNLLRSEMSTIEKKKTPQGTTIRKEVMTDAPDHILGVRLGNGLFLDYNRNLSVDLIEFFGLEDMDFNIVQINTKRFSPRIVYNRSGSTFDKVVKKFMGGKVEAFISPEKISIQGSLLGGKADILITDTGIMLDSKSILSSTGSGSVILTGHDTLEFRPFRNNLVVSRLSELQILAEKLLEIYEKDNEIIVNPIGYGRTDPEYRFVRYAKGFSFLDSRNRGVSAVKEGNTITVYSNGKSLFTAEIETK
jgi:hypothetical protein